MIFAKMKPAPNQVEETKLAFFAGYWAALCAIRGIGEPDVSEAAGIRFMEDREREGEQFYKDLIKRYAEGN